MTTLSDRIEKAVQRRGQFFLHLDVADTSLAVPLLQFFYLRPVFIEDVVVDYNKRGQGIGKMLTEYAINYAKEIGCRSIDLTSSPSREAANYLYKKMGFKQERKRLFNVCAYGCNCGQLLCRY